MSDEKPMNPSPDDLTKTKKPSDVHLAEEDLGKVSGGIDGLKGESLDTEHKNS